MIHSDSINEIAAALATAQGLIKGAKKDSDNPFFKSKYADLAAVAEACRAPLSAAGIAVVQAPSSTEDGRVTVTTLFVHSSGQWIAESVSVKPKDDGPQALGSAITYLRRYALAAFAGVAPEDDDGEAAEGRKTTAKAAPPEMVAPKGFDQWFDDVNSLVQDGGTWEQFKEAWNPEHVAPFRDHLARTKPGKIDEWKRKAIANDAPKPKATRP